tara:strand:+ start:4014 stop:4274 length:261 start_codon:yes stop_codon:yes gene_type:complete
MSSIQINRCFPVVLLFVMLAGRGTEAGDFPPEGTQPLPVQLRFAMQFHSQPLAASEPLPPVQQLVRAREQGYRDYLKILHIGSGVR